VLAQVNAPEHLDFHFADADLRVRAPQSVLAVLDQMFARIPREWSGAKPAIALDVIFDGVWHIAGSALSATKVLGAASSLPQVSGACVSSLLAELAANASISIWRAAIVEFEGNALALVGDDWETAITLAAHLHARGWRIVSGDYGLVDLTTMTALPFRKLLHVSSSSVASFPLAYRGAVEASPWYSSAHAIAFYAIDPTLVNGQGAWAESSRLRSILKVDGRIGKHPSLEVVEDFAITESLKLHDLTTEVGHAMLIPGSFIETADFLERWFRALPRVEG
jgi:hypothetical protein